MLFLEFAILLVKGIFLLLAVQAFVAMTFLSDAVLMLLPIHDFVAIEDLLDLFIALFDALQDCQQFAVLLGVHFLESFDFALLFSEDDLIILEFLPIKEDIVVEHESVVDHSLEIVLIR